MKEIDPKGPCEGFTRVYRGGGWPGGMPPSIRWSYVPQPTVIDRGLDRMDHRIDNLGLRVVCSGRKL